MFTVLDESRDHLDGHGVWLMEHAHSVNRWTDASTRRKHYLAAAHCLRMTSWNTFMTAVMCVCVCTLRKNTRLALGFIYRHYRPARWIYPSGKNLSGFRSVKSGEIFLVIPGWVVLNPRVTPALTSPAPNYKPGGRVVLWEQVSCPRTQHSASFRTQTRIARSGVQRNDYYATTPQSPG